MTYAIEELEIDVTAAIPHSPVSLSVSASMFRPEGPPKAILVCWPGGSYDRRYWTFPALSEYSFARYMAGAGFAVVAADHLGVGRSSQPTDLVDQVNLESMAAAADIVVSFVRRRTTPNVPIVGVGHSIGGCAVIITQARFGSYDRIVSLGYTHGSKDSVTVAVDDATSSREAAVEQAKAFFTDWDAGYATAPRQPNRSWLYQPDTPKEVVDADNETIAAWPRQAYVDSLTPGYSTKFAAQVTCPIMLGFGENDVPQEPRADVAFYKSAPITTLQILPNAAHNHNFATTRTELWDSISRFALAAR